MPSEYAKEIMGTDKTIVLKYYSREIDLHVPIILATGFRIISQSTKILNE